MFSLKKKMNELKREAEKKLNESETILYNIFGLLDTKINGQWFAREGILAITENRVIFQGKKESIIFPNSSISNFTVKKNFLGHQLSFEANNQSIAFKNVNDGDIEDFIREMKIIAMNFDESKSDRDEVIFSEIDKTNQTQIETKKTSRKLFKKSASFEVIGGKNLLPKSRNNKYTMIEDNEDGVVKIQNKKYYFLGLNTHLAHKRSTGKAAAGAIIGGALTGGVGAIVGAAIGGRRKDDSTATLDFMDYETKQVFSVQVKPAKNHLKILAQFPVSDIDVE